jgi:hypothetical protein
VLQHPGNGSPGDAVGFRKLAETLTAATVMDQGSAIYVEGRPANAPAFQPGAAHAGAHPFDNQVSLQLMCRSPGPG